MLLFKKKNQRRLKMDETIDIEKIIDEMKDRLFYLKKETAELAEKIEIAKTAIKYRNGKITRDEMQAELRKIVYKSKKP